MVATALRSQPSPARRSNASTSAYKRMVTTSADDGTPTPHLDLSAADYDIACIVHVFDLTDPHAPQQATYDTAPTLMAAAATWGNKQHWIHVQPAYPGQFSQLGLAQAMIILQRAHDLPPFSVLDCLEGGNRVRLDKTQSCVYMTLVAFHLPSSNPFVHAVPAPAETPARRLVNQASSLVRHLAGRDDRQPFSPVNPNPLRVPLSPGNMPGSPRAGRALHHTTSHHALHVVTKRHVTGVMLVPGQDGETTTVEVPAATADTEAYTPALAASGSLLDLLTGMMVDVDVKCSHICHKVDPRWQRACFFVTRHACISVYGGPADSLTSQVQSWFASDPGSVHEYMMERRQGPDFVFYKLLETSQEAVRPLLTAYLQEMLSFEEDIFASTRQNLKRDMHQTLQLHLIDRELSMMKSLLAPAERCFKQLLKMPARKQASGAGMLHQQALQELAVDLMDGQLGEQASSTDIKLVLPPLGKQNPGSIAPAPQAPNSDAAAVQAQDGPDMVINTAASTQPAALDKASSSPARRTVNSGGGVQRVTSDVKEHDHIFSEDTIDFLEEVRDDAVMLVSEIEKLCSAANDLTSLLFNLTAYRTTLSGMTMAGVSAVFLPLTWVCGVYGTNFEIFPELTWGVSPDVDPQQPDGWAAGYFYFWMIMIFLAVLSCVLLRRMGIF